MRKHLSLIGVLLVLVVFHLGPNAEAQIDDGYFYVSPAVLMGMNFDFSGDSGLEFYPSLSFTGDGRHCYARLQSCRGWYHVSWGGYSWLPI